MQIKEIAVDGKIFKAFEAQVAPDVNIALIKGSKGFIMCGFLNIEAAEKKGVAAAIVTGVKTAEEMLAKSVTAVTSYALKAGIKEGMPGAKALEKIY